MPDPSTAAGPARHDISERAMPVTYGELAASAAGDGALGAVGGHLRLLAQSLRPGICQVEIRPAEGGVALVLRDVPAAGPGAVAVGAAVAPGADSLLAEELEALRSQTRVAVATILHTIEMAQDAAPLGRRMRWVDAVAEAARQLLARVEGHGGGASLERLPGNRACSQPDATPPDDGRASVNAREYRIGAGQTGSGRGVAFDPAALLRDVMGGMAGRAAARGVTLESVVHGDLPERVEGDATGLRRVLRLLTGHAVENTLSDAWWVLNFQPGGARHKARLEVGYRGELDARLAAWLQGQQQAGADASPQGEPWAEHRAEHDGGPGASLGLARRLVEREMGGKFGVAVRGGQTRFTVELLWGKAPGMPVEPVPDVVLHGKAVLAVTPDASLRKLLQARYAALGLRAMTVDSAAEARRVLTEAAADAFDLVLVQYERETSLALAQWLRDEPHWRQLPRLTVSLLGEPGQAAIAEEAGYHGYLTPPLPLELLRDAMAALLARAARVPPGGSGQVRRDALVTRFSLAEAATARARHTAPLMQQTGKEASQSGGPKE